MHKSFIFDWSGTLSNNFDCFCKVCDLIFTELGRELITPEEIRREMATPYMKFWNKYLPDLSLEKEFELYEKYIHQAGDTELYPGVKEVIGHLHRAGYKIFITTSDPESKLVGEIEKSGLKDFLSGHYSGLHDKTDTIKKLVETTPLNIEHTFYVGDTSGEVEMGRKAGVKTIGVSWGFQSRANISTSNPDFLIDDILEIKKIIQ